MTTLGALIRVTREAQGIRAADLAYEIGKDPAYISRLERDITRELPSPNVLKALSRRLGLPERRLMQAAGYLLDEQPYQNVTVDPRVQEFIDLLPYVDDMVMDALRMMTDGVKLRRRDQLAHNR